MNPKTFALVLYVCAMIVGAFATTALLEKIHNQQRQIDQLCQIVVTLAEEHGAKEQMGFVGPGKEYCFFFADYKRNLAIVGEFDGDISYNKKPKLVILHNVDKENLEYWNKQPTVFGYKKIP